MLNSIFSLIQLLPLCDCLLSSPPVLAELQQADLMTSEECKGLGDPTYVVEAQKSKSSEVLLKSADILRRHGFEKASNLLAGKQTQPLIPPCACGVLYSGA